MALTLPAFAITESEVEAQVSAAGQEAVTGNVLIWFLCAVGFLKISQKIDSFMASLGVNVGHTGGSMLAEAMIAMRGVTMVAGAAGKAVGGFAGKGGRTAGGSGAPGAPGQAGSSWPMKGGLAGVVSRTVSRDAVKTATSQTGTVTSHATHSASAAHTASATQAERVTDRQGSTYQQSTATRQTADHQRSATASQTSTQQQRDSHTSTAAKTVSHTSALRHTSLGGAMFTRSLLSGGKFANEVISKVASGDIRSTGSITGDLASQALLFYTGITALGGPAAEAPVYKEVEIGGGRITGTEATLEHPEGIAFGIYHTGQYATKPDGEFQSVHTADGQLWYKQYAVDTVVKTPFKAPDGEVDYHKNIVKKLSGPPKRKDRM